MVPLKGTELHSNNGGRTGHGRRGLNFKGFWSVEINF